MPVPVGSELIHEMTDFYIEFLLISFSSGCVIFESLIYEKVYFNTLLFLGFSIVYWFLPMDKILEYLFEFL